MQAETLISLNIKHYTDGDFVIESAFRYHFYLSIAKHKISCVIADPLNVKVVSLKTFSNQNVDFFDINYEDWKNFDEILEELKPAYKSKFVLIDNEDCLIAPESLCNIIELEAYYQLHKPILENSQMSYCKLHIFNTSAVFNLRNETIKFIRFEMPTADLLHQSQLFIKAIAKSQIEEKDKKIFVNVHEQFIEVLATDGQNLQFYNTFKYDTETDFVYYILSVADLLGMESNQIQIMLFGDITNTDTAFEMLKKYAARVQFGDKLQQFYYPIAFNQFSSHQHFVLSSCLLCE
ncbi:MAG: DUF3822 family protein [Bacteroidetes bacterium]|nr:DUF3822 family protein [Bacteroidota bacterium]